VNLLDIFFPKFCLGCKTFNTYLCSDCQQYLLQEDLICPICNKPAIGGVRHPLCQKRYGLDGLWSLGSYEGLLEMSIKKLKYEFVSDMVPTLVDLLIEYWAKYPPYFLDQIAKDRGAGWVIVPVPLHKKRYNWRGFNQSALLAKLLAKRLGIPYQEILLRIKNTRPQVSLEAYDRHKNIKNAFEVNSKFQIQNSKFLLIDDVWTTGSTMSECANVLKRNGAKAVWAITIAR
jgi:competence protein ComFC